VIAETIKKARMEEEIAYIRCDDCGRMVPELNLPIHKVRACGGHARLPTSQTGVRQTDTTPEVLSGFDEDGTAIRPIQQRRTSDENINLKSNKEKISNEDMEHVIDLSNEDANDTMHGDAHDESEDDNWSCPQCTLVNQNTRSHCEACHYYKNSDSISGQTRCPDPTRSERLIDDSFASFEPFEGNGTLRAMGNGALVGSLLGGATSYVRGRSVADGIMEGALSGAASGALMDSIMSSPTRRSAQRDQTEPFASFSMSLPGYSPEDLNSRRFFSSSFQSVPDGNNGSTTTFFSSSSQRVPHGLGQEDVLLRSIFNSRAFGATPGNPDGMTYEQILQTFGDGTENMGANEEDIQALPTSVIKELNKELPEGDARQCCICLDEFENGDTRKTLPCLHGFHEACIDRALRNRNCCPICNISIQR